MATRLSFPLKERNENLEINIFSFHGKIGQENHSHPIIVQQNQQKIQGGRIGWPFNSQSPLRI